MKKAMVDKVVVVDIAKFSAGPSGFDKGCRWRLIDPSDAAEEPLCEDPTLVDPTVAFASRRMVTCFHS